MKRILKIFMLSVCLPFVGLAQSNQSGLAELKTELETAVRQEAEADELRAIEERLEAFAANNDRSWMTRYWMAYAGLHLAYRMENKEEGLSCLQAALQHLEECLDRNGRFSEAYILEASIHSYMMSLTPQDIVTLSDKVTRAMRRAARLEPENPRLLLTEGSTFYYTPEAYGGGMNKAKASFLKSVELFGTYRPVDSTYPTWGEDEACQYLAQIFVREQDLENAKRYYERALEINPTNRAVQNALNRLARRSE